MPDQMANPKEKDPIQLRTIKNIAEASEINF